MLEKWQNWRNGKRERKEKEAYGNRMEYLTIAYALDAHHLNAGWTGAEFTSQANEFRKDRGEKPLRDTQFNEVLEGFVREKVLDSSHRKGYSTYFRLSEKGRKEIKPIMDELLIKLLLAQENINVGNVNLGE